MLGFPGISRNAEFLGTGSPGRAWEGGSGGGGHGPVGTLLQPLLFHLFDHERWIKAVSEAVGEAQAGRTVCSARSSVSRPLFSALAQVCGVVTEAFLHTPCTWDTRLGQSQSQRALPPLVFPELRVSPQSLGQTVRTRQGTWGYLHLWPLPQWVHTHGWPTVSARYWPYPLQC